MRYGGMAEGVPAEGVGDSVEVPFVLPGELVAVEAASGGWSLTKVDVVEASADRVSPGCRHFGVCGGCQYQEASYGAQLGIKEGILKGLLAGAGLTSLPEIVAHAAEPWGYRNRVRMRVEVREERVRVGYSSRGTTASVPEFVAIEECPIAAPVLWRGAQAFVEAADKLLASSRWLGSVAEVELFSTADGGRVQMTVFVREQAAGGRRGQG